MWTEEDNKRHIEEDRATCPLCESRFINDGNKRTCPRFPDEHTFIADKDGDQKWMVKREVALRYLNALYEDFEEEEGEDEPRPDFTKMSNKKLGEEICLSGIIHDEYFGKVVD